MIKAREYYSDVYTEDDDKNIIKCEHCNCEFESGDMLLKIPNRDDYNEDEITEHCPKCKSVLTNMIQ